MTSIVDLVQNRVRFRPCPAKLGISAARPIEAHALSESEAMLGFPLPPDLKDLYVQIGNGGFGPGYGLLGLLGGFADDLGETAVSSYRGLRSRGLDDGVPWPQRLLPICNWGCAIYSCIDCSSEAYQMTIFDPNPHRDSCVDWSDTLFSENIGFPGWIELWARGTDLWERLYGEGGIVATAIVARESGLP